jgi:hypothetical protein
MARRTTDPAQVYVAKLSTMLPTLPAPIHTFGFGYSICSGLLKSIAEITDGNYAFVPDAGMIVSTPNSLIESPI